MIKNFLTFGFLVFISAAAQAGAWAYVRPEVDVAYTDNVFQDDYAKVSDIYSIFKVAAQYKHDSSTTTGSASLFAYSKEKTNNGLSYLLRHTTEWPSQTTTTTLAVGGFNYFKTQSGATDEAYNNTYLTGYLTSKFYSEPKVDFYFEPGLKYISYPNLDDRSDTNPFLRLNADWFVNETTTITPYTEIGENLSNQTYYRRRYADLGVSYNQKLTEEYALLADLYAQVSRYTTRKVGDVDAFYGGFNGRTTSKDLADAEQNMLTMMSLGISKVTPEFKYSLTFNRIVYKTYSELEYFHENQFVAAVQATF